MVAGRHSRPGSMSVQNAREHVAVQLRELWWYRLADHLPEARMPVLRKVCPPVEGARDRLQVLAFEHAQHAGLSRMKGVVTADPSSRRRDRGGRAVWVHAPVARVTEPTDEPPASALFVQNDWPSKRASAARALRVVLSDVDLSAGSAGVVVPCARARPRRNARDHEVALRIKHGHRMQP